MSQKSCSSLAENLTNFCNSFFKDHAVFRLVWTNLSPVIAGKVWRSNHPTPWRFKKNVQKLHLKSIINLRGNRPECGSDRLGRKACAKLSLPYEDMAFESRNFPQKERILKFHHLYQNLPKPLLIHCKSGADRAGLASALILLFEGYSVKAAQKQLHWRFLHFRQTRTGVLDDFLSLYHLTGENQDIPFLEWVQTVYEDTPLRQAVIQKRNAYQNTTTPLKNIIRGIK